MCIRDSSKKIRGKRKEADLGLSDLCEILNRKITRAILLSIVNTCYDPMGLVAPITIQLKIEMRELYRFELKLGWDDDIPYEKKVVWHKILQLLKLSEKVRFKRSLIVENAVGTPDLLIFCDGSPMAMCTVGYIRWHLEDGSYTAYIIAGKTLSLIHI